MENTPTKQGRWYFSRRVLAFVIDYAIYSGFWQGYARYFGVETEYGYEVSGCLHFLVLIATWVIWLPLPEAIWGMTFGKWTVDLRVADMRGHPIDAGQAIKRRLFDPIDLGTCFGVVGFIVAKTNTGAQRLGDLVAKTMVIERDQDQPPKAAQDL